MKEPIFEHGDVHSERGEMLFLGTSTAELTAWIDSTVECVRQGVPTAALGVFLFSYARELERRQLAAAPKINHEKFLERLDRELHEGRFEEDYPGQHPLSRRTA